MTRRRALRAGGIVSTILAIAIAIHQPTLRAVARLMVVEGHTVEGALILPMSDPEKAADIYRSAAGYTLAVWRTPMTRIEQLALVRPEHERVVGTLTAHGIPLRDILVLEGVAEDFVAVGRSIASYFEQQRVPRERRRVIAVVASPWSRLRRDELNKGFAETGVELSIHPVAPTTFDESRWWLSGEGLVTYFDVYILWILRSLRS